MISGIGARVEQTLVQRGILTGRWERVLGFRPGRHIISRGNKPIGTQSVEAVTTATGSRIAAVAYETGRFGLGMWRSHLVVSLVVLETLGMIRIAGSPDAVIRNAGDRRVPTEMVVIVRVGRLGIRVKIVVLLVVIRVMEVEVRKTTRRIPMPVPTTKSRNDMTGSLTRSGEASFLSQVIGFGGRGRTDRKATCGVKWRSMHGVLR